MIAGAGPGLMLTPASTDAVNRAARTRYSEVTGITQTARNIGASVDLAVLGTILVSRNSANIAGALVKGVSLLPPHTESPPRSASAKRSPAPDARRRSCAPSILRSHTQPRRSST
jgi:hypothetical protein